MCSNHFDLKFRSTSWYHSSHKIFRVLSPYQIVFSRKVKKNKIQSHWLTGKIWIVENIFSHYIFKKMCWRFCFDYKLFVPKFLTWLWWWKKEVFFNAPKKKKISKQSLCSVRFFLNLGSSSKYFLSFLFYCFLPFLSLFLSFFLLFFLFYQPDWPTLINEIKGDGKQNILWVWHYKQSKYYFHCVKALDTWSYTRLNLVKQISSCHIQYCIYLIDF